MRIKEPCLCDKQIAFYNRKKYYERVEKNQA